MNTKIITTATFKQSDGALATITIKQINDPADKKHGCHLIGLSIEPDEAPERQELQNIEMLVADFAKTYRAMMELAAGAMKAEVELLAERKNEPTLPGIMEPAKPKLIWHFNSVGQTKCDACNSTVDFIDGAYICGKCNSICK